MSRHRRRSIPAGSGQTVTVTRDLGTDETGDSLGVSSHTIDNCVHWITGTSESTDRRKTSIVTGRLGVPRGEDIVFGDRVALADGTKWSVTGPPEWDQDHPMSGHDFGHMVVEVRSVT